MDRFWTIYNERIGKGRLWIGERGTDRPNIKLLQAVGIAQYILDEDVRGSSEWQYTEDAMTPCDPQSALFWLLDSLSNGACYGEPRTMRQYPIEKIEMVHGDQEFTTLLDRDAADLTADDLLLFFDPGEDFINLLELDGLIGHGLWGMMSWDSLIDCGDDSYGPHSSDLVYPPFKKNVKIGAVCVARDDALQVYVFPDNWYVILQEWQKHNKPTTE